MTKCWKCGRPEKYCMCNYFGDDKCVVSSVPPVTKAGKRVFCLYMRSNWSNTQVYQDALLLFQV